MILNILYLLASKSRTIGQPTAIHTVILVGQRIAQALLARPLNLGDKNGHPDFREPAGQGSRSIQGIFWEAWLFVQSEVHRRNRGLYGHLRGYLRDAPDGTEIQGVHQQANSQR